MIEEQGEDSQCAAWIYTSEDIVKYDDDGNEVYPPQSLCDSVLCNLQDYDNIHTTIYDSIESELAWLESNNKVAA